MKDKTRKKKKRTAKKIAINTKKYKGGRFTSKIVKDRESIFSNDKSFDKNPYVRESHNCYMYFLNKKNKDVVTLCQKDYPKYKICRRAQPGYISGFSKLDKKDYKCPNIMERTLGDNPNIYRIKQNDTCIPSHYKGALVVAPNRDYHYYRQNDDGVWSHKPGYKPSTRYDSDNNLITNPQNASRNYGGTLNYKDFCGFLCVPRNDKKKRMGFWNKTLRGGKGRTNPRKNKTKTKSKKN